MSDHGELETARETAETPHTRREVLKALLTKQLP